MSNSSGQSNGYQLQQPTAANPNGYGGQNMRYGDPIGSPSNWGYAQQNLPGTPFSYQEQAAGLYGTPFQSDPNQYGRWNWASQMQPPGNPNTPAPGNPPGNPYIPPGTPPPATGGGSTQQPDPNAVGAGGQPGSSIFTQSHGEQMATPYSQAAVAQGMNQGGDIWSNPAFANLAAASGGGSLFGPSAGSNQALQQKMQEAAARRAANNPTRWAGG